MASGQLHRHEHPRGGFVFIGPGEMFLPDI
jgi:hypothetical protein